MALLQTVLDFILGEGVLVLADVPAQHLFWGTLAFFGFVFFICLWLVKWFFKLSFRMM